MLILMYRKCEYLCYSGEHPDLKFWTLFNSLKNISRLISWVLCFLFVSDIFLPYQPANLAQSQSFPLETNNLTGFISCLTLLDQILAKDLLPIMMWNWLLMSQVTLSITATSMDRKIVIGRWATDRNEFYSSIEMDELFFFNQVLTDTEITMLKPKS